jgi:acetyl esterase/lipase
VPASQDEFIQETLIYRTVDGLALPADVIYRPGRQRAPAILWLHGGALIRGSRAGLAPAARQRYLQAGFVVVPVDYRLGPETRLPGIISDVQAAYAWLRAGGAGPAVDPERVVVLGQSAGGYLTLLSGHWLSPRPLALVSFFGYGDILGDWYRWPDPFYCQRPRITDEAAAAAVGQAPLSASDVANNDQRGRYYHYTRQRGLWPQALTGHDPDREPEYFDPFCPVRHVGGDYPPLMLLHGDADTDVPVAQSLEMAAACEQAGTPCILKVLPGYGHGFDNAGLDDPVVSAAFDEAVRFMQRATRLA